MISSNHLAKKTCVPCREGVPPLKGSSVRVLLQDLGNQWTAIDERCLEKEYVFKNFRDALNFTNRVADIAERENHHPEICLSWGKVVIKLMTQKIGGLTESDFILAAKCDDVYDA